jgi:YD repeat-containing protein
MPNGMSCFRGSATIFLLISMFAPEARAASASVTYTYDAVGRVATALYDNGTCIAYSYDPSGNRTSQTNTTSTSPESPTWGTGTWGCFQWTASESGALGIPGQAKAVLGLAELGTSSGLVFDGSRLNHLKTIVGKGDSQ